jgi:N-acetylmuramoyl-L-alanine amidase
LASGSQLKSSDSQFKSYRGKVVELLSTGRYRYKYCVGRYATQAEAKQSLAEVKQQFSDAYIIRFEGNEVAR